jgi:hypothetical protein
MDADAEALAAQLAGEVQITRRRGLPLRLLFDNRQGSVFSSKAADALVQLKANYRPRDRTAVLVSDGLHKLQTKRNSSEGTQIFVSEPEAMIWLTARDA